MQEIELQRAIEQLDSADRWEQDHASYVLGRSADPRAFEVVLRIFRERDRFLQADQEAIRGLVDGAPATIPLLISSYAAAPNSPEGDDCRYALGEIAVKAGCARDSRIDAALFTALRRVVDLGTNAARGTVHALRELARAKPVREATPWLWRFLERSRAENDLRGYNLQAAMEALEEAEGESVDARLAQLSASVHPDHDLAGAFELFLQHREQTADLPWRSSARKWRRNLAGASDEEVQRTIDTIESLPLGERIQSIYDLARSTNPRAFELVMRVVRGLEHQYGLSRHSAVHGLIDGAPETIPLLTSRYSTSTASAEGNVCAYAMGEIAYPAKLERDQRIDVALLAGLERVIDQGTDAASATVEALRECARAKPAEGAAPQLWRVVERGRTETDPNPWCLRMALLTLKATEGDAMRTRLRQLGSNVKPEHPLAALCDEVLNEAPAPP